MNVLNIKTADVILNKAIFQSWKNEKYSYKNNERPDYGFLYLIKGFMTYCFDDRLIEMKAGDIIYLPKNSKYEVTFDIHNSKVENILINFDTFGNEAFSDIQTPFHIFCDSSKELYGCFSEVVKAYTQKGKSFYTNISLYQAFDKLQKTLVTKSSTTDLVLLEKGAALLTQNFESSIEKICAQLNMSRSVFQKKFKKHFGVSPIEYRGNARMEKAKLLLETTDIPIKEIVDILGYYDTAYFYKIFEKHTNLTPKIYREKIRILL